MWLTAAIAHSQSPLPDGFNPGTDGSVYALAVQPDGKILIGGQFNTVCGQTRSNLARVYPDGALDAAFNPAPNGVVNSLAMLDDGRIMVGGAFSMLAGQPSTSLVRLSTNGQLETSFALNQVYAISPQADQKMIVAGKFMLKRFTSSGSLDNSFQPNPDGDVLSLAVEASGKLVVGGSFATIGGQSHSYLARLSANGAAEFAFDPSPGASVYALTEQADGKILVAGAFTNIAGGLNNRIARLRADGTLDTTFDPGEGANDKVFSLALQTDGKILLGGSFTSVRGEARNRIARLNSDGTLDGSFNPGADAPVYALGLQANGSVLLGGSFSNVTGIARRSIASLPNAEPPIVSFSNDATAVTWLRSGSSPEAWRTSFAVSTNGSDFLPIGAGTRVPGGWQVNCQFEPSSGSLRARAYVSGAYQNGSAWYAEGYYGRPLILVQPASQTNNAGTTAIFRSFAQPTEEVSCRWLKDGVPIELGGNISGATNNSLTVANCLGDNAGAYTLVASNRYGMVTSAVATLTVIDPILVAQTSGQTNVETGQSVTFSITIVGTPPVYQWYKDGTVLNTGTSASLTLTNLQMADSGRYWVVAHNSFGSITGAVNLLRVSGVTLDPLFNPQFNGDVYALALQPDGKILVGGYFSSVWGQPHANIVRLNPDGTLDNSFNPSSSSPVIAIALQADGKIVLGTPSLVRLHPDGTRDNTFASLPGGYVVTSLTLLPDGKILAGCGTGLYRINPDGSLDDSFHFSPGPGQGNIALAIQADGKIVVGGYGTRSLGRYNPDGSADTSFSVPTYRSAFPVAVQPNQMILVSCLWEFSNFRPTFRLFPDGASDPTFNPAPDERVHSLILQADGKIVLGGGFNKLGGEIHTGMGRLNTDGSLDTTFSAWTDRGVFGLALQPDGNILIAGPFMSVDGQARPRLARLNNSQPATQSLIHDQSTLVWLRGGSSPEVWRTTFLVSTNGVSWKQAGEGTRIPGGWMLSGLNLTSNTMVKARGYAISGYWNASSSLIETIDEAAGTIYLQLAQDGSDAVLNWVGGNGPFQVQQTTNPCVSSSWENLGAPVQTNSQRLPISPGNQFFRVHGQ